MKNKLYIFGCSYSSLFGYSGITTDYKDYLGQWPKHWSEILSENLNLELVNLATGGNSNDGIFDDFCKHIDKINSGDIVIIGWSYITRIRVVEHNEWVSMSPGYMSVAISQKTLSEMCVNRNHPLFEDELHNREFLIQEYAKLKGITLFLWNAGFPFKHQPNYLLNDLLEMEYDSFVGVVRRHGGNTIEEETNNIIKDIHLGRDGNIVQAELFYSEIKSKLKL